MSQSMLPKKNSTLQSTFSFVIIFAACLRYPESSFAALIEDWQTIFPDTRKVVKLFGSEGPSWRLYSTDGAYSIPAKIPGDVLSDLFRGGIIENPYYDRNFYSQRHVWMGPKGMNASNSTLEQRTRTWVYETVVFLPNTNFSNDIYLIVEGIKMGASIFLNDIFLGNVTDQFIRYTFLLNSVLDPFQTPSVFSARRLQSLTLSISFPPDLHTYGRFQACSGGWDWAPYTRTGDAHGSRTFTFGIWKPIYIIEQNQLSISHVVPKIFYLGDSVNDAPRNPMLEGPKHDFKLLVDVHFTRSREAHGYFLIRGNFTKKTKLAHVSGSSKLVRITFLVPKAAIKLWWPNSRHQTDRLPNLYELQVKYVANDTNILRTDWVTKLIGFRTLDLITINDTDSLSVEKSRDQEGSGNHGMFLRVNGAFFLAKGANVVPMDQLEGRLTDDAHRAMVQSAADAGMNMIRVWGGGMPMPKSFYDACDRLGILVYHDMLLVEENNHGARKSSILEQEIIHLVQSLVSHPSIALWSGCNECVVEMDSETAVYATFVMEIVAREDPTRPIWPSSPSFTGWKTGVYRINGKPNGNPLSTYKSNEIKPSHAIEQHGPYRHGISTTHPSVNWNDDDGKHETNIPPLLNITKFGGPKYVNTFISEFGVSTWSSFESISANLSPSQWSLHGSEPPDICIHIDGTNYNECRGNNVLAERNYACDSQVEDYFGKVDFSIIGEEAFRAQLYKCIMASTLWLKGQIEIFRAGNTFGALIWQLNENWPTGGWGLLEYGSSQGIPGQILGGRWKPAMFLLKQALFRDVFATCGLHGECYIRNDRNEPIFASKVLLKKLCLTTGESMNVSLFEFPYLPGDGSIEQFRIDPPSQVNSEVHVLSINDYYGRSLMNDYIILWTEPKNLEKAPKRNEIEVTNVTLEERNTSILLTLLSNQLVLFVSLVTSFEGNFEENLFLLQRKKLKTVRFHLIDGQSEIDLDKFQQSLQIKHLLS